MGIDSPDLHKSLLSAGADGEYPPYQTRDRKGSVGRLFEDRTHLIPPPGFNGERPERYNPLLMRLPIVIGLPIMLFLLGAGLEVIAGLSRSSNGFPVPVSKNFGVLGPISSQFLAAFVPALLIMPNAIAWRELDWMVRMYQPYLSLIKGNPKAEESLLLNYVELGPILSIGRAFKYKHRLVFISAFTAALTYLFQPLTSSVFQIRQVQYTSLWDATTLQNLARATDSANIDAFLAAAGYTTAGVFSPLPDPFFVCDDWTTASFTFPINVYLNATLSVETWGVNTNANCSNPVSQQLNTNGKLFNISATSVDGCSHSVSFDPNVATPQQGVDAAPCPGASGTVDPLVDFRPIMFWYYHTRNDTNQAEAKAVFCSPIITASVVKIVSDVKTGNVLTVDPDPSRAVPNNDVFNGAQAGRFFNGVTFTPNANPVIQARANSVNAIIPDAILRSMALQPGGLDAAFDAPNGVLSATTAVYTRHLAISAQGIYFSPANTSMPATLQASEARLVVDAFPAHILAVVLIITGVAGTIVHLLHRSLRMKLRLAAEPGTIASVTALTSRSGFGDLLTPYDGEITMERKLKGLTFGFDGRTGAIVARGGNFRQRQLSSDRSSFLSEDSDRLSMGDRK